MCETKHFMMDLPPENEFRAALAAALGRNTELTH
jgi:hypothetical protein